MYDYMYISLYSSPNRNFFIALWQQNRAIWQLCLNKEYSLFFYVYPKETMRCVCYFLTQKTFVCLYACYVLNPQGQPGIAIHNGMKKQFPGKKLPIVCF